MMIQGLISYHQMSSLLLGYAYSIPGIQRQGHGSSFLKTELNLKVGRIKRFNVSDALLVFLAKNSYLDKTCTTQTQTNVFHLAVFICIEGSTLKNIKSCSATYTVKGKREDEVHKYDYGK